MSTINPIYEARFTNPYENHGHMFVSAELENITINFDTQSTDIDVSLFWLYNLYDDFELWYNNQPQILQTICESYGFQTPCVVPLPIKPSIHCGS